MFYFIRVDGDTLWRRSLIETLRKCLMSDMLIWLHAQKWRFNFYPCLSRFVFRVLVVDGDSSRSANMHRGGALVGARNRHLSPSKSFPFTH